MVGGLGLVVVSFGCNVVKMCSGVMRNLLVLQWLKGRVEL